jgi:carboxyl-terminal processing protease
MNFTRTILERSRPLQLAFIVAIIFAAGFALGSHSGTMAAQGATSPETEKLFQPLWEVYDLIRSDYVDPNDKPIVPEKLVDGAISGMVDSLGDQFSGYMDPEIYPLLNDDLSGAIEGIGVVIRSIEEDDGGGIEVVSVMEGTPAAEAGIRGGDIFTAVDGDDVTAASQLELAAKVRGPAGSDVKITMRRGEELIDFVITRARIEIPNIESSILENSNVAYIKLNQFSSEARSQIDDAITELDVNNRTGLIFDLRGNPGGLLNSAIDVASAFIKDGPILIEDFGQGNETVFNATGKFNDIQVPIVVLVDESSASASELVAGALQDTGRATILGETTLGKGTVQTWRNLANGGGVRLTIARWLTPNRHWIHGAGITPDVIVEWNPEPTIENESDPQLEAALEQLQSVAQDVQTKQEAAQ